MVQHRAAPPIQPRTPPDYRSSVPLRTQAAGATGKSRAPLFLGGALVYGLAVYAGYRYFAGDDAVAPIEAKDTLMLSKPEVYDDLAAGYDAEIGFDETLMGLTWLRWYLCRQARGDVLEASCGTGRNISYFKPTLLKSITFVDQSPRMIEVCEKKWQQGKGSSAGISATFKAQPLEGLSPNREQFDTVVQTFGLCSVADPSGYLSHLSTFLRPSGEILLLEHGRSKYAFINRILDKSVDQHAQRWGCYYNRDVQEIVGKCQELEVVSESRFHFGTTSMYRLRHRQPSST
jgi:methyltransferase OMS1